MNLLRVLIRWLARHEIREQVKAMAELNTDVVRAFSQAAFDRGYRQGVQDGWDAKMSYDNSMLAIMGTGEDYDEAKRRLLN